MRLSAKLSSYYWQPQHAANCAAGAPLACAGELVASLGAANQEVPQALLDLAAKDSHFRKGLGGGKRGGGRGGRGRGRTQARLLFCPVFRVSGI